MRLRSAPVERTPPSEFKSLKFFLDTGAVLALADEDDDYHSVAKSVHAQLLEAHPQLLTSNFVLAETYTLIRFKVNHPAAVEFMKRFDPTGIKILRASEAIEHTAKAIFTRYDDKELSFVDCTSFALIDHHRIDHAFAFDNHFRQYRFKRNVTVMHQERS